MMELVIDRLNACIQQILNYDPNTASKIAGLSGKTIAFRILPFKQPVFMQCIDGSVAVSSATSQICSQQLDFRRGANERAAGVYAVVNEDSERVCNKAENSSAKSIDLLLEAYPDGFIRLMFASSADMRSIFGKGVHVEGDIAVAQQMKSILEDLDIDWLSLISRYFGDIPAYYTGKIVEFGKARLSWVFGTMRENMTAYLQDELRLVPVHDEILRFRQEVSRLQMDVERLERLSQEVLV